MMELPVKYSSTPIEERKQVREEYIKRQQGRCMWCNELFSDPPPEEMLKRYIDWSLFPGGKAGFLKPPIHLQHNHDTDMTEGAVHAFCNAYMWFYHKR